MFRMFGLYGKKADAASQHKKTDGDSKEAEKFKSYYGAFSASIVPRLFF
jgi:hypothetical protein